MHQCHLKSCLLDLLLELKDEVSGDRNIRGTDFQSPMTWTGNKSDLVELIFAIQAAGSVNQGQVQIKQLAEVFEKIFNIKLGNYYDYLQNFRMRKSNQTIYLDDLRNKLVKKLEKLEE